MERLDLEIHKCALCYDAPCKKIYKNVDPERIIRALRFDNLKGAKLFINENYLVKNDNCGVKCPLGANNIQLTTAIMEYGYRIIDDLILGLKIFMKENNFHKVSDFVGISKKCVVDSSKIERDTILFPKFNYDKCVGCGRCFISCEDGGHSAIKFELDTRKPQLDVTKCVGCHLCKQVCPNNAISIVEKRVPNKNARN